MVLHINMFYQGLKNAVMYQLQTLEISAVLFILYRVLERQKAPRTFIDVR